MTEGYKTRQSVALGGVILAPFFMGAGLCSSTMTMGLTLFAVSASFLIMSFVLCLLNMRETAKEDNSNVDLLKKMMEEGTLKQHLKDAGWR